MSMPELRNAARLYSRAERAIKRAERITLQLPVAPVNQLRYAGFHILRAVDTCNAGDEDVERVREDILKAENHCRRSWLDSFECTLLYLLKSVQKLYQEAAGLKTFLPAHPEIAALQDEINAIQDDFIRTPLSQAMPVARRVRLLHEAQRLGRIKRQILRAYSADGKGGNGTPKSRAKAKDVKLRLLDRQFLVSFTATVCGTIAGLAGLVVSILIADSVVHKISWAIIALLASTGVVLLTWQVAKKRLLAE